MKKVWIIEIKLLNLLNLQNMYPHIMEQDDTNGNFGNEFKPILNADGFQETENFELFSTWSPKSNTAEKRVSR